MDALHLDIVLAGFPADAIAHSDLELIIKPPGATCASGVRNWYFSKRVEEHPADIVSSLNELLKVSGRCSSFRAVPLALTN